MSQIRIGYTSGVYDLFHIGHLNLLRNAKSLCDKLIVGVSTDELVAEYKNKQTIIPFSERIDIIRNCKFVDVAIPQNELDKFKMWEKIKFNVLFVGDDWYNSSNWKEMEEKFKKVGVEIIYFPYTKTTSSTLIRQQILPKTRMVVERERERVIPLIVKELELYRKIA